MANLTYKQFISDKDNLFLVECWARDGLTKLQMAHNIGVTKETFTNWLNKHEEFRNAVNSGCEIVDYRVECALLKRALGYTYNETKTTYDFPDEEGNRPMKTEIKVKEVPPDVNACLFWLNNRKPDRWKRNNDLFENEDLKNANITINVTRASETTKKKKKEEVLEDEQ